MIPTDPKEAANLGKVWGETLTDSVFGIADDLRKVKAKNQATAARNELVKINNEIAKNNQLLRQQAMREIAEEQERARIARMTPAQKQAYANAKARAAKAAHDREVEAENMKQYIWAGVILIALMAIAGAIGIAVLRIY
jgi:L-lactate utilization protein LutC